MKLLTGLADRAWLPDAVIRTGIGRLNRLRLSQESKRHGGDPGPTIAAFVKAMHQSTLALATNKAKDQHYEVPAAFFEQVLGKHLKYSCALWKPGVASLDQAEADMLATTAARADIADGMDILELGCGWGGAHPLPCRLLPPYPDYGSLQFRISTTIHRAPLP